MPQSQYSQAHRQALIDAIVEAKIRKNLTFEQINEGTGLSLAFETAALLGQHPLPAEAAKKVADKLELAEDAVLQLQTIPVRGSIPDGVQPTPPSTASTKLSRSMDPRSRPSSTRNSATASSARSTSSWTSKVPDPEGGHRAVITLDGKYLLTKPF